MKMPWVCKHLSETLVPAPGLHGRGRLFVGWQWCPGQAEYHVSQCKSSKANVLFMLKLQHVHMPWGSLPGFSPQEGCRFTLTSFTPVGREGAGRDRNPYFVDEEVASCRGCLVH